MGIAHPDLGLVGPVLQDVLVKGQGLVIIANLAKGCGRQVLVIGIIGVQGQDRIQFGQGLLDPVLAMQDHGQIRPGSGKARGQIKRAPQQVLSIAIAANPSGQFGQHADRRDIGGNGF